LKRPGPPAKRRYKVLEAFLAVEKQVVAPDALRLAVHPASIGSIPRAVRRFFNGLLGPQLMEKKARVYV
jgi:hypothetical protein